MAMIKCVAAPIVARNLVLRTGADHDPKDRVGLASLTAEMLESRTMLSVTGTPFYTADTSQPAYVHEWYESKATRVTWRASEKNKFNFFADPQRDCHCPANVASGNVNAPEAFFSYKLTPAGLYQASWNYPRTNRLLFEAGAGMVYGSWPTYSEPIFGVHPNDIAITDSTLGITYNAPVAGSINPIKDVPRWSQRGTMSYVTGTHNMKFGVTDEQAFNDESRSRNNQVDGLNYDFLNAKPIRLQYYGLPFLQILQMLS
jgi:hypothetical protein